MVSIKQLIWRLYFILVIRFFLCDRLVVSVSWGFIRQKVNDKVVLKTGMRVVNLLN